MGKRKNTAFAESLFNNMASYDMYLNRLVSIAISSFQWKGLPKSIDERFLEKALLTDGKALYFNDDVLGNLALKCSISGQFNVYDIPKERTAYASNGYQTYRNIDDSVVIYDNLTRTVSLNTLQYFAKKLYNIDTTIDVNVNAQKTPILLTCDETQKLTMMNLYKEYQGNAPMIYGSKGLDTKGIHCIQTGAPYLGKQLSDLKRDIWAEALSYLGVYSSVINKAERVNSTEETFSHSPTLASRNSRLKARQQACEQINEMFGVDISVEFNYNISEDDVVSLGMPSTGGNNE